MGGLFGDRTASAERLNSAFDSMSVNNSVRSPQTPTPSPPSRPHRRGLRRGRRAPQGRRGPADLDPRDDLRLFHVHERRRGRGAGGGAVARW